jgi:hypothetical protein
MCLCLSMVPFRANLIWWDSPFKEQRFCFPPMNLKRSKHESKKVFSKEYNTKKQLPARI